MNWSIWVFPKLRTMSASRIKIKLFTIKLQSAQLPGRRKVKVNAKEQDGATPKAAFKNRLDPIASVKIPIK